MNIGRHDTRDKVCIIAEVGSNHCGKLNLALEHIRVAANSGVQAVKFQLFRADQIYPATGTADYLKTNKPLYDVLKEFEMPLDWIPRLKEECDLMHVEFLCTPFFLNAIDQLNPFVPVWKIASFELNWLNLIHKCRATKKPIILSTGAATMQDIEVGVMATKPNQVALLHCTSKYPTGDKEVNINALSTMQAYPFDYLPNSYGVSDHTLHPFSVPCASVALGGRIIEKHFTLRRDLPSPDALFSLTPESLNHMVDEVRRTECILGYSIKQPIQGELTGYKRTLYATEDISAGSTLTEKNTVCLRNTGYPDPVRPYAIGSTTCVDIKAGSMIQTGCIE